MTNNSTTFTNSTTTATFTLWQNAVGARALVVREVAHNDQSTYDMWTMDPQFLRLPYAGIDASEILGNAPWHGDFSLLNGFSPLDEGIALITPEQFKAALTLARAYGHEWALAWNREVPSSPTSVGEIASHTRTTRHEGGLRGIESPAVDSYGDVTHSTGTGRLSWDIARNGVVSLVVSRPQGWVLSATSYGGWEVGRNPEVEVHERHLGTLLWTIRLFEPEFQVDMDAIGEVLPD